MSKRFPCDKCGNDFYSNFNCKRHKCSAGDNADSPSLEGSLSKPKKEYVCLHKWCSRVFNKTSNLKRHVIICTKPSLSKNKCFMCKKEFSRGTHLRRHMEVCTKRIKMVCPTCGTSYAREDHYHTHLSICSNLSTMVDKETTGGESTFYLSNQLYAAVIMKL